MLQLVQSADVLAPQPLWFPARIAFDMHKRRYERDLKFDLFATQSGCRGQSRDLVEGTGKLSCGFDQRRAFQ